MFCFHRLVQVLACTSWNVSLCVRKPVYVQMCTSVSICRVHIQTHKMTIPLRRNTTHQQCTGKRLSRALVVLYQWKIGMPHLCDSTVARPALPRDNALVNRCEYPLFCYPVFLSDFLILRDFYDVCGLVAEDGNMMFGAWIGNTLFVAELWGFAWGIMRLESSKTNTWNQRKSANLLCREEAHGMCDPKIEGVCTTIFAWISFYSRPIWWRLVWQTNKLVCHTRFIVLDRNRTRFRPQL